MSPSKSATNISDGYKSFAALLFFSIAIYLFVLNNETKLQSLLAGDRSSSKPYNSFEEFYPFYISQHQDSTCRALHFIGTSLVIILSLFNYKILLSMFPALFIGLSVRILSVNTSHGIVDAVATLAVLFFGSNSLSCTIKETALVLLIGYGFAWVGHFYFENNRPATFIHPVYSLIGDFRLWFEILTKKVSFTEL